MAPIPVGVETKPATTSRNEGFEGGGFVVGGFVVLFAGGGGVVVLLVGGGVALGSTVSWAVRSA